MKGRAWEWREQMADRVVMQDGSALDMLDSESIRAYVRRQLALSVEPTAPQLKRLEMLEEHAAKLEAKTPAVAAPSSIDDLAAARERLRQARLAERQGK